MKLVTKIFSQFFNNKSANFSMMLGLITPTLLAGVAGTIDFTNYQRQVSALQDAADYAALASVKEARLPNWNIETAKIIAANYVDTNLGSNSGAKHGYRATSTVDEENQRVTVNIEMDHFPYFFAALFPTPQIEVSATAVSAGTGSICVIGLHKPEPGEMKSALHFDERSEIKAGTCSINSNSPARYSLRHDKDAKISASFICAAGGLHSGQGGGQFSTPPITDCPPVEDPLKNRMRPTQDRCNVRNIKIGGNRIIHMRPGVYCGGVHFSGNVEVNLYPGVYVIKDGPLVVKNKASLKGVNVGFHLVGEGSTIDMGKDTTISLVAPKSGVMAGMLFSEDPSTHHFFRSHDTHGRLREEDIHDDVRMHKIQSNNARNLLGTIYLPISLLKIGSERPIADESAYTAIVVGRLWLQEGSPLVLNTDYESTDVPVPDGLNSKPTVRLEK